MKDVMTSEHALAVNVRLKGIRDFCLDFLNNTKVIYLERDLIEMMIDIDCRHREEIQYYQKMIESLQKGE